MPGGEQLESAAITSFSGRYRFEFEDQLHWIFSAPAIFVREIAILTAIFALMMSVIDYVNGHISVETFFPVVLFAPTIAILMFIVTIVRGALYFRKLSSEQRDLTLVVSPTDWLLTDGAGASLRFPWSQVRAIKGKRSGYRLVMSPFGARWIVKRVLSDADWAHVMEWAKERGVPVR